MADDERYVVVYRRILTDPEFAGVRSNREALGTWLLLLLEADALWPAPPSVPRWVVDAHLTMLTDAELIAIVDGDRYRVRGLDAMRQAQAAKTAERVAKASAAAAARWSQSSPDAPSNAPSNAPSIPPSNAKPMPPNPTHPNQDNTDSVGRMVPTPRAERSARRRPTVTGFKAPFG